MNGKVRINSSPAPVLILKDAVLFPGITLPIVITSNLGIDAVNAALSGPDKSLVVISIKSASQEKVDIDESDLYQTGTRAVISRMNRIEGSISLILIGIERVKVSRFSRKGTYFEAEHNLHPIVEDTSPETEALHRETLKIFSDMKRNVTIEMGLPVSDLVRNVQNPLYQTYLMAVILGLGIDKEQNLLEAPSRIDACKIMYDYISYEQNVQKLRDKISNQVVGELGKEQREYVLRRQMDEIQKELGGESGKDDLKTLEEQMIKAELPEKVFQEAKKQLKRLSSLTMISPEYQVTHTYLENIIELPWNKRTDDNLDIARAESVLDEDHFDLKDVKQRIIEQLAVLKLNPTAKAPILCFVGPPGVGKTSLGQSIARALGRKFERMSLGGMHDEAELRGHRRTYIGAMPGRIIEAIRRAGVNNPIIMLDEIDKLGVDFRGDPASALMEILDPAQNYEFHDNYLDLPFDLSRVVFITTANTTQNISRPLLDRMEQIRISGYTEYEKVEIAKRYLVPREAVETGIQKDKLVLSDDVLGLVIREYTREAGVRELQRCISHIARKIAIQIAKGNLSPIEVTTANLVDFLGQKKVFLEHIRKKWGVGLATGMAWTEAGGDIIYIETSFLPKRKDEIKITGHIGEIMKESVTCALSYVWSQPKLHSDAEEARESGMHIHIPAGSIPKDGPSAGVAIVVALVSLHARKPVKQNLAMTGEITLSGLILPVGGIKEKVLAAHRAGIREIVVPSANEKDLEDIPPQIRGEIKFILADDIMDVLSATIPNLFTLAPLSVVQDKVM